MNENEDKKAQAAPGEKFVVVVDKVRQGQGVDKEAALNEAARLNSKVPVKEGEFARVKQVLLG